MKHAEKLLAALLALGMVFSLCACGSEPAAEETWSDSAEGRDGCIALVNDFFAETFKNTNQTVTVDGASGNISVEMIDGSSSFVQYAYGTKTYAFKDGADYLYAVDDGEMRYYTVSKDAYDYGYFAYTTYFDLESLPPDNDGYSYACSVQGSRNGEESVSTLTLEMKSGEGPVTVTATAKNGLVERIAYTAGEGEELFKLSMTIVYGNASVTVPDISGWSEENF